MPSENKNLKDLVLKKSYDPSVDGSDVLNEFYIPCLKVSKKYSRISAYFSSAILKQFSSGLVEFYKNDGKARFIFSCEIEDEEMNAIVSAYEEKMDSLADSLDDTLLTDYEVANLAYLIKHNLAEVKIAFMIKNRSALMHIKSGLFEDNFGNKIYFDGSGNETEFGILNNAELFNVFSNFEGNDYYVNEGEKRFEQIWNNCYSPSTIRTEFPTGKLFKKLISFSKDRIFENKEQFFVEQDCVFIDIDANGGFILLTDYTKESLLKLPMVLKTIYKERFNETGGNIYFIDKLTLHDIRDIIPERVEKYGKKVIYSDNANAYIQSQDLKINKRVKLAESIKTNQNSDIWQNDFEKFKYIVNCEMIAKLKEQQLLNAYHHYAMKSSMDFSVPGTGKTYISYGLFSYLFSSINKPQDVNHLVVFGPLNCFKAWKDECKSIFGSKHTFTIFDVTDHHNDFERILKNEKYDIYLFNYEFITENKIDLIAQLVLDDRTLLVFDEIHKLKAISGTRANNVLQIIERAKSKPIYKLALTGTPLPNSYVDLYNYLKILYFDDLNGFLNVFSINQLKQADTNDSISRSIQSNLHPLFMRTTKKDLNITPANDDDLTMLSVKPTEYEERLYELIFKSYQNPLLKFIRLIQASSNPQLLLKKIDMDEVANLYEDDVYIPSLNGYVDDESVFAEDEKKLINQIGMSSKTKRTLEFLKLKVANGKKVIVWCLFIDTIDLIKNQLQKEGIDVITVSGRDDPKTRDCKIDSFKNGNAMVLITNPNTLAESVSLHHACHNAIYLEFGFNLTYLLQSKDRIHRVGLEPGTETNYYFAISDSSNYLGSIDKRIYNRLQIKAERMRETIESNNLVRVSDTSDLEDIKYILGIC